jgi:hypothetical protein
MESSQVNHDLAEKDQSEPDSKPAAPSAGAPADEGVVGFSLRVARRIVIATIGGTVVLIGVAMLVLPGPAVVVIPLGLAILATEFVWARRWLRKLKRMIPKRNGNTAKAETKPPR